MAYTLEHTFKALLRKPRSMQLHARVCAHIAHTHINKTHKIPNVNVRDCSGGKSWDEEHIIANPARD